MEMLRLFWDEAVALDPSIDARDERHMPLCRAGELSLLWRANGLDRVEEQPLVIEQSFTSFDDYWIPFLAARDLPAFTWPHCRMRAGARSRRGFATD
jgi:hypothetical protein